MTRNPNRLPLVIGAIALLGGGAFVFYRMQHPPAPVATPVVTPTAPAPTATPTAPPPVQHPIEQAITEPTPEPPPPVPTIEESDDAILVALGDMLGSEKVGALLKPQFIIQRFVATVDSLPRRKLQPEQLPVKNVPGNLIVLGSGDAITLAPANAQRYTPYVDLIEQTDAAQLVSLYVRLYPLFQQAYRELGDPEAYFNDRLIAVIDHLLAAQIPADPIYLQRPKVFYLYTETAIEERSAGEKLMIRLGPGNAARVKKKLHEIRRLLTNTEIPAPASP